MKQCVNCGKSLDDDSQFCKFCGAEQPDGSQTDHPSETAAPEEPVQENAPDEPVSSDGQNQSGQNKFRKFLVPVICAAACIIAAVLASRRPEIEEIDLAGNFDLTAGESYDVSYEISPSDIKDPKIKWESSDTSVATVEDGTVTGVDEGTCTITASASNGVEDSIEVKVKPEGPDLIAIYYMYCDPAYAYVTSDGSSLEIDTDPNDTGYSQYEDTAAQAIVNVTSALGLPESILTRMSATRALDGTQTYDGDEIMVQWTYHPDNGLDVIYSLK